MNAVARLYRRLDQAQRGRWFRVMATMAAVTICAWVFGSLIAASSNLEVQRRAFIEILSDESSNRTAALTLADSGFIVAGGRSYGGPEWKARADLYVDRASGLVLAPQAVSLIEHILADQKPAWAPDFLLESPQTTWLLAAVFTAWLVLIVWMNLTLPFLFTLIATALGAGACWRLGSERWMLAVAGIGLLSFTYVLLTRAVMLLFQFPAPALAVAHTVVKEASRLGISITFIVLLLVGLPLIPTLMLESDAPLRFRIQTFMSTSLNWTYGMAALMTIFLGCATVAFEIRDRQIWHLMTKPLARFHYLLGKWLGVMSINLVLLIVSGLSVFVYIQYLRQQPVAPGREGQLDRLAVTDQILTARVGTEPAFERLEPDELRRRVAARIEHDPDLAEDDREGRLSPGAVRALEAQIWKDHLLADRSIPPGTQRTYNFSGLGAAKTMDASLTLQYKFYIGNCDPHERFPVYFVLNENPEIFIRAQFTPTVTDVRALGPDLVRPDGTLSVTIVNPPREGNQLQQTMMFQDHGFELLYKAAEFESNFMRAMITTWIKLAFLGMLAIAGATFLSFPVACLLAFTLFIAASIGPFLAIALDEYWPTETRQLDWGDVGAVIAWAFQNVIRFLAQGISFAMKSFGESRTTQALVEGRLIPWGWAGVVGSVVRIGLIWSGTVLLIGYAVFRRRELATYSGHGQ